MKSPAYHDKLQDTFGEKSNTAGHLVCQEKSSILGLLLDVGVSNGFQRFYFLPLSIWTTIWKPVGSVWRQSAMKYQCWCCKCKSVEVNDSPDHRSLLTNVGINYCSPRMSSFKLLGSVEQKPSARLWPQWYRTYINTAAARVAVPWIPWENLVSWAEGPHLYIV